MSEVIVAKRYAVALLELGQEQDKLLELKDEIETLQEIVETNPEFITFLSHPKVTHAERVAFIESVFVGFSERVIHTLQLLVERHRVTLIPLIAEQFIHAVGEVENTGVIRIDSAEELSDTQVESIRNSFKERLKKIDLQVQLNIDRSLMGGLKVSYENTVYDGTILNKLKRLEHNIRAVHN